MCLNAGRDIPRYTEGADEMQWKWHAILGVDCMQDRGVYSSMWVDSVSAEQLLLWEINPYAPEMEINISYVHILFLL